MSSNAVVFICALLVSAESCLQITLNDYLFGGDFEFIDLTHPFDKKTIYWMDVQPFKFTKEVGVLQDSGSWYAAKEFAAGEHGGTHIDAPYHFARTGLRAGEIPLANLIVPLIVIDVTAEVNDDPNFFLYKHHLENHHQLSENVANPCVLIFKFGWSQYFGDRQQYLGLDDQETKPNFPGLSNEVAEWIVSHKSIVGVGVDTASLDPGSAADFPAHKTLLGAGVYGLENVRLARPIPEYGCTALVLPMKIAKGSGAPLRLVAICPNTRA